jgi:BirA family biotin operon repressor/biotin-[acetyl-CoA-carboxylase] ligase
MTLGKPLLEFDKLPSTNSFLLRDKSLCSQHGLTVWAHQQTEGRGRAGRSFVSPSNEVLTFSVVIHSGEPKEKLHLWALWSVLALFRNFSRRGLPRLRLKWPNDLLHGHQKLAGILVERGPWQHAGLSSLIIGIGLNVNGHSTDFPTELQQKVTTLQETTGTTHSTKQILKETLDHLQIIISELRNGGSEKLLQEWQSASNIIGQRVGWEKDLIMQTGIVERIESRGFPQIRQRDGRLYTHIAGDLIHYDGLKS